MKLEQTIAVLASKAVEALYNTPFKAEDFQVQKTSENFEGDLTLVVFPLSRIAKKAPPQIADDLGSYLAEHAEEIDSYNVVKGFLNLVISDAYWLSLFHQIKDDENFGKAAPSGELRMVEYSSPNTNKPLHLGHLRNIFLGHSVSEILKANGHEVVKVQVINDRGIHICMSMLAWQKWGNGETPESSGLKGDHLVGKYYVAFNTELSKQCKVYTDAWKAGDFSGLDADKKAKVEAILVNLPEYEKELAAAIAEHGEGDDIDGVKVLPQPVKRAKKKVDGANDALKDHAKPLTEALAEARAMLLLWEKKDPEVYALWETMNGWVYQGFDQTYQTMGVGFDKLYYESSTWVKGKEETLKGLERGVFTQEEDGSIWCDLTEDGLDKKILLRSDGTAVYMTQDIGTAILRFEDYPNLKQLTYTVGNEQEYHFKVLFLILEKIGMPWAKECHHLSYGMVELPHGKMKSRTGTVVDADELMAGVVELAEEETLKSAKLDHIPEEDLPELFRKIGLGALKYYLLKVDPRRGMKYDPQSSLELTGNTGVYLQYAYTRTRSLMRKYEEKFGEPFVSSSHAIQLMSEDKELLVKLSQYPSEIAMAAEAYSPAGLSNYIYDLASDFSTYWSAVPVFKGDVPRELTDFRMDLALNVGKVIKSGLELLGIEVPERM